MANCFRRPSTTMPASPSPRSEGEILQQADLRSFAFKDLKTATMNFRPGSVLGDGGFGSVFKGWVDETTFAPASHAAGMPIAVKLLRQKDLQGHTDWLVWVNDAVGASNLQSLSWDLRMKVALGAAKGLAFLHSDKANIIYGDFRTSHILLDSSYNAKLSAFGLPKDVPKTVDPDFYIDELPSYYAKRLSDLGSSIGNTEDPTSESDVYSFGVVLLELLAGRRRLDRNRPSGEQDLVEWARPHLRSKRQISHILDARLGGQYSLAGAQKAAALALKCLSSDVGARPGMEQVVVALEQLQGSKETAVSDRGKGSGGSGGGTCGFVGKFGGSRQQQQP